jgi:hypothetical protein
VSGDELDDAIDTVVREIMGAEPPAGLRQRVFRRLSEPDRRRLTAPRLAFVAALALCVAIGAVVARRSHTTPPVRVASTSAPVRQIDPPPVTTPSRGSEPVTIAARHPRHAVTVIRPGRGREPEDRMVSATSLAEADTTVVIAPLDPIRKIETEPMGSEVVHIDEITVAPLQMERVRVDPLSSPPR